ncbi:MAG: hypothetical protein QT10_C0014G0012 [archaeon GW2011_AR19]|nr:MAG: hypothetical protein QT10_C0014G0012 [archaeon GW2011_AR19]
MTKILFSRLRKIFPEPNKVSIYGAYERIYLSLHHKKFADAVSVNVSHKNLKELASKIFEIPFEYEKRGEIGPAIFFEPKINRRSHQNYQQHYIKVSLPLKFPEIEISTGNRGSEFLFRKQRDDYYKFVEETYFLFLEKCK